MSTYYTLSPAKRPKHTKTAQIYAERLRHTAGVGTVDQAYGTLSALAACDAFDGTGVIVDTARGFINGRAQVGGVTVKLYNLNNYVYSALGAQPVPEVVHDALAIMMPDSAGLIDLWPDGSSRALSVEAVSRHPYLQNLLGFTKPSAAAEMRMTLRDIVLDALGLPALHVDTRALMHAKMCRSPTGFPREIVAILDYFTAKVPGLSGLPDRDRADTLARLIIKGTAESPGFEEIEAAVDRLQLRVGAPEVDGVAAELI